MLPFTAVSLVSALASDHPVTALSVCKGPPARHCPLRDRRRAGRALGRHRLLSALPVVMTVAAAIGLLRAVVCPGPAA